MLTENKMPTSPLFILSLDCKTKLLLILWFNIVKNGKFNDAKKYIKNNQNLKIILNIKIIDEKRTHIRQEKNSKEVSIKDNFIIFNNEKIIL